MVDNEIRDFLVTSVINAAIHGGAAIMEIYSHPEMFNISLKSDQSPITEADRKAHDTIKESLGKTRIPILSEEGREMHYDERCNWELFWLVDPLDGTVEFINRSDEFTVNIALMSENKPIAAVVYTPSLQRLFFAARSFGSFVWEGVKPDKEANFSYSKINDSLTQLPLNPQTRSTQIVAISRSHNTPETFDHIELLRAANNQIEVIEQGSSYKFCLLAEGSVDYYVRTSGTYEWDTAAGELILAEAGGSTRSLDTDQPLAYNKELLDNPWFVCRGATCTITTQRETAPIAE
ncbi:MAG: 3'(2'),5'-bisphosphate nucleotidase CysQ [Rikenellaceae bacterium]